MILEKLNELITSTLDELINRISKEKIDLIPNIRFWRDRRNNMYAYTSNRSPDDKFYALYYKYHKTEQKWELTKKVKFSRRKIAIMRVNKWYKQAEDYYEQLDRAKKTRNGVEENV